jgi:acetyl esterase/lipase
MAHPEKILQNVVGDVMNEVMHKIGVNRWKTQNKEEAVKRIAKNLALFSFVMSALMYFRLKMPRGLILAIPKLLAGSFSPFIAITGFVSSLLGILLRSPKTVLIGAVGGLLSLNVTDRVIKSQANFEQAFGYRWQEKISSENKKNLILKSWDWYLPDPPQPVVVNDLAYWSLPEKNRELLCDLWLPGEDSHHSGIGIIFLHGSGWVIGDKHLYTQSMFRHLVHQGHMVMDVAYRMYPEVHMSDMVGDVKRAVAWLKSHAEEYQIDPSRIVLMGASAGGHLALLSAYTPNTPELTPPELTGIPLEVCGVISYYGPADLTEYMYRYRIDRIYPPEETAERRFEKVMPWLNNYYVKKTGRSLEDLHLTHFHRTGRLDLIIGG